MVYLYEVTESVSYRFVLIRTDRAIAVSDRKTVISCHRISRSGCIYWRAIRSFKIYPSVKKETVNTSFRLGIDVSFSNTGRPSERVCQVWAERNARGISLLERFLS